MEKAFRLIDILVKIVLIIFTSLMCFIVLWQVISRFILNNPSRWSEEVARYLMIWITFLGASVGVKTASHLGLTIFVKRYKDVRSRLAVTIFSYTCIIIFSLVLVIYGYEYMVEGQRQVAMSFKLRMSYVYACIPLSGLLMVVNASEQIASITKRYLKGEDPFYVPNALKVDI